MFISSIMQFMNQVVYVRYSCPNGYFELSGRLKHICESCIHIEHIDKEGNITGLYIIKTALIIDFVANHMDEKKRGLEACFNKEVFIDEKSV